ncbi:MAG: YceI family protein [Candidatus Obscuribacterales bacterium]|nr:YceI family protein [Steroidobacteraceae bacterium]
MRYGAIAQLFHWAVVALLVTQFFLANQAAHSKFVVTIDTGSVNSKDKDRDDTLRGADLFDVRRWPQARYVAEKFTHVSGNKSMALGSLTIRDVSRTVSIEFTFEPEASSPASSTNKGSWLIGSAKLKCLEFGVGQGEWRDTQ